MIALRASQTVKALKVLAKRGWLEANDLTVLTNAYKYYRDARASIANGKRFADPYLTFIKIKF